MLKYKKIHQNSVIIFINNETGYYYLNARMYDPITARFLQEDTYRGSINDPLSLNLYTYCSNEPIMYIDPTGHYQAFIDGDGGATVKKKTNIIKKSLNSFKEIGIDQVAGAQDRGNKAFDSPYDFVNWITVGASDAIYTGAKIRGSKALNSPYDFVNWMTIGIADMIKGAFAPEEPFSKGHWMNSFGAATLTYSVAKPVLTQRPVVKTKAPANNGIGIAAQSADDVFVKHMGDIDDVKGSLKTTNKFEGPVLNTTEKQFGKKIGKHAQDYGLDPSNPNDRAFMNNLIEDIHKNPSEVRQGNWMGLGEKLSSGNRANGTALFYRQGNDVVVTDTSGNFVTILKDGATQNTRFQNSIAIWTNK